MNKKIIIISVILVLIAIIIGIVLSLAKKEERKQSGIATTTIQSSMPSTLTVSDNIDTSDWEIYRNEEFGFEFKHPGESDGWIYRSPAYRKFTNVELEAYQLESKKHKSDQWAYQTKDNLFGPYYVFGLGIRFEGEWAILVTVIPRKIDDFLMDTNYGTKEHWDVKRRESIVLGNGLKGEKVTWANDMIVFYVQKDDYPLTIGFSGYNDLTKVMKEERNKYDSNNKILLKIISYLKFIEN